LVDEHASHLPPRVVAFAGFVQIIMIRLVAHSLDISQPLDLYFLGLFKMFKKKEQKSKGLKRETLKIYHAMLAFFYKTTIIPMVR
jgi:hypothetical protein